jgi:citrate synthase
MEMYEDIYNTRSGDLEEHTKDYLKRAIEEGKKIYGFGHPLFRKDPRPPHLRNLLKEWNYSTDYMKIYDVVCDYLAKEKNIHPNIDGINGAILLSLGFKRDHGTGLFLLSRTSAMLAHVVEERTKEPFYSERRLYPILRMLEKERK